MTLPSRSAVSGQRQQVSKLERSDRVESQVLTASTLPYLNRYKLTRFRCCGAPGVCYPARDCAVRVTCPFRKSDPQVAMVQSRQDGNGGNGTVSLDRSTRLAEDEHLIQALAAQCVNQTFQ